MLEYLSKVEDVRETITKIVDNNEINYKKVFNLIFSNKPSVNTTKYHNLINSWKETDKKTNENNLEDRIRRRNDDFQTHRSNDQPVTLKDNKLDRKDSLTKTSKKEAILPDFEPAIRKGLVDEVKKINPAYLPLQMMNSKTPLVKERQFYENPYVQAGYSRQNSKEQLNSNINIKIVNHNINQYVIGNASNLGKTQKQEFDYNNIPKKDKPINQIYNLPKSIVSISNKQSVSKGNSSNNRYEERDYHPPKQEKLNTFRNNIDHASSTNKAKDYEFNSIKKYLLKEKESACVKNSILSSRIATKNSQKMINSQYSSNQVSLSLKNSKDSFQIKNNKNSDLLNESAYSKNSQSQRKNIQIKVRSANISPSKSVEKSNSKIQLGNNSQLDRYRNLLYNDSSQSNCYRLNTPRNNYSSQYNSNDISQNLHRQINSYLLNQEKAASPSQFQQRHINNITNITIKKGNSTSRPSTGSNNLSKYYNEKLSRSGSSSSNFMTNSRSSGFEKTLKTNDYLYNEIRRNYSVNVSNEKIRRPASSSKGYSLSKENSKSLSIGNSKVMNRNYPFKQESYINY